MTIRSPRLAAAAALAAAAVVLEGCGATLYDAQGVPKLACTTALPLACGFTCLAASAENDAQCGAQCLDCRNGGANALSGDAAATNFCNVNDPDVALHACDFSCPSGFVKNPTTQRCDCGDPLQTRCGGATACTAQTATSCGDTCVDCTSPAVFPAHAHASATCDATARVCAFTCDATFQKSPAGDACVCKAGQVACGGGAARSSCIDQTTTTCGSACVNCADPAQFAVSAAVTGTLCGGDGKGVAAATPCDYSCPAAAPNKFFNTATGKWDCSAAPVCDPATQHLCASDNTCHPNTDVAACGAACTDCRTAPHPGGSTPTCVPTTGTCSFDCPSGTIRNGLACVRAQLSDGSVAVGGNHTCAITTADTLAGVPVSLFCWGANASGQLGLGGAARADAHKPQLVPLTLAAGVAPAAVVAGAAHTCSLATDGGVQCWGSNATAQLGADPATLVDSASPRAVTIPSAKGLAAGTGHTCAIVNVGTGTGNVLCWGANDKGQLGGGTTSAFSQTPVQVKTGPAAGALLSTVAQLSTSGDTTCAFTSGGVFCWGANDRGQAGQAASPAVAFATLVPIAAGTKIGAPVRVAAGGKHTCAATSLDTACWGDDTVLELGDAGRTGVALSSAPIDAAQLTNRADLVAAGRAHSCNVRSLAAGDLAPVLTCAGANDKLQSGSALASPSLNKGDIALPAGGVTLLVSGGDHTCTVTAAGALLCFGSNTNGQLGDGTTTNSAVVVSPLPQ